MITTRYLLPAVGALLLLILSGCQGSTSEDNEATPGTTAQQTPPSRVELDATPVITGNLFESPEKGYSVRFPEGWLPVADFLPGPDFTVDAFFAQEEEVEGVQPNIAVTCEAAEQGTDLQEYFDRKVDIVRQVTEVEPEVSSRQVSGEEALVYRFSRKNEDVNLEKTEVFFVTERCVWSIALTAPYGDRAIYSGLLDDFLESFRLLP